MRTEDKDISLFHCWLLGNHFSDCSKMAFHVPNEGKRTNGAVMVGKGVVSGIVDYIICYWGVVYFMEFKSSTGTQTVHQKEHQRQLQRQGFNFVIVRSFEEARAYFETVILPTKQNENSNF